MRDGIFWGRRLIREFFTLDEDHLDLEFVAGVRDRVAVQMRVCLGMWQSQHLGVWLGLGGRQRLSWFQHALAA
jgi:hypothetical protein